MDECRHVDDYSLKTNFARTTNFKYTYFDRVVDDLFSMECSTILQIIRMALFVCTFRFICH